MDFDDFPWIKEHKKKLMLMSLVSILFSTVVLIIKTENPLIHLAFAGFALVSYPIGYVGGLFVMSIQAYNSFCPVSLFDTFSDLFIKLFLVGFFIQLILIPILSIAITHEDLVLPNMALGGLGFAVSIIKVREKFFTVGRGSYSED